MTKQEENQMQFIGTCLLTQQVPKIDLKLFDNTMDQKIYKAMDQLGDKRWPIDIISISENIGPGASERCMECLRVTPTSANMGLIMAIMDVLRGAM